MDIAVPPSRRTYSLTMSPEHLFREESFIALQQLKLRQPRHHIFHGAKIRLPRERRFALYARREHRVTFDEGVKINIRG